jgi:metallo-beta-lactamase family protein
MGKVTFCGACGTVTGSCSHLSWADTRILVDCGLYQGNEETEQLNWAKFPFVPADLSAVVITHAHLDHTGLLPRLFAEGFSGPIYCTRASRGLISLILQDAGHIQEEQARYAKKKGYSRHRNPKPLYTADDARKALKHLKPMVFDARHEICPGIHLRFRRSGHLLGAASVEIRAKDSNGDRKTWCFSGDIGRYNVPIIKDPEPPMDVPSALVLESTYGDRTHQQTDLEAEFRQAIRKTFAQGGTVIIPAFALGRTQEVLYHLSALVDDGELDPAAVFLDSPMAIKATDLYDQASPEHDAELIELIEKHVNPLAADRFQRCRSSEQSKALNRQSKSCVIVASSGMANGGRVVHHLKRCLPDPRNTVIFVGYQASGTRGRALVNGAQQIAIHRQLIDVRAEITSLHGLSAHAGQDELIQWCHALPATPERIFLNHGEDDSRKTLAARLSGEDWPNAVLPMSGETVPW